MRRLILDTNVALDLLLFDDPRCEALRLAIARGEWRAVTNDACRDEWRRVLRYPSLQLDATQVSALEAAFDVLCEVVAETSDAPLPRCRDADDQKFLELARDAGASVLVTRDAQLLRLSRRALRAAGFTVTTPEALGDLLGS